MVEVTIMGTRADYYVGRGTEAEWLGSTAWDGYPDGITKGIREATSEAEFRREVDTFLKERNDATTPDQGWPWPWEDSRTTDYAYALDGEEVYVCCFGHAWVKASEWDDDAEVPESKDVVFPNMKDRQNVDYGKRSGLIVLTN